MTVSAAVRLPPLVGALTAPRRTILGSPVSAAKRPAVHSRPRGPLVSARRALFVHLGQQDLAHELDRNDGHLFNLRRRERARNPAGVAIPLSPPCATGTGERRRWVGRLEPQCGPTRPFRLGVADARPNDVRTSG